MRKRKRDIFAELTDNHLWNLWEIFHENTKINKLYSREYGTFIETVTRHPYFLKRMAMSYKLYAGKKQIKLPKTFTNSHKSIETIIRQRRTRRNFSGKPITIEETAKLLYFSYGINAKVPIPKDPTVIQFLRVTPSAGALYPLELYINIFLSQDIKPGLYHYNVLHHALEELKLGDFRDSISNACMIQQMIKGANAVLFITGIFKRTTFKYHERGYRFVLMESGHVAQNLSLICEAISLGSVLIGGFHDDEINSFLEVDGVNEAVLYPIVIGKPVFE
ncbi:MAG TPA: SagB/ThcOx family dehydrogenase [candidate division WOR-3 bacterium]|uniref:SagB/ThcOx family dehydrogenase n=1 Tax=candidate division WOR-3 bacterium TaxID=2052148 RepID=A0A9C9EM02_UNCW3|nr:SagB/ThcOx family dehydrogenase [candidate division WOR-3 bacterium]